MIKKNKKGAVVLFFSAIVMVVIFGIVIFLMATQRPTVEYVGMSQLSVLNAYEFTENTFAYIDMSVEIASSRASERLASEAGQLREEFEVERTEYRCGQVVYPLINDESGVENCMVFEENAFKRAFRIEFDRLLRKYDKLNLREYDYDVEVELLEDGRIRTDVVFVSPIRFPLYPFTSTYHEIMSADNWIGVVPSDEYVENEYGYLERGGLSYGSRGRASVDTVVMHYTAGRSIEAAYNALEQHGFSYHYLIDREDGKIYQFVPEDKAAWHAGGCEERLDERNEVKHCRSSYEDECVSCVPGYNSRSIGISFVGCGYSRPECKIDACYLDQHVDGKCWDPFTEEQFESAARLVAEIAKRHPEFKLENDNIVSHSDIAADKADPGPGFDERREDFIALAMEYFEELES